jgi:hypothetical protein
VPPSSPKGSSSCSSVYLSGVSCGSRRSPRPPTRCARTPTSRRELSLMADALGSMRERIARDSERLEELLN